MGFEPTTFCMASRRSSQLSYSRAESEFSVGVIEGQASPKWSSDNSNQASVPRPRVLAPPIVGEAVDQHQAVAAAVVDPVARYGAVGAGIEDLDPHPVGRGSQAYLHGLVRPGAAVLDGVRNELAQQAAPGDGGWAREAPPGPTDTERRAAPAALVPPGTENDTFLVAAIASISREKNGTPRGGGCHPTTIAALPLPALRRRGGVATQRPAKPFTPVRFWSAPLSGGASAPRSQITRYG